MALCREAQIRTKVRIYRRFGSLQIPILSEFAEVQIGNYFRFADTEKRPLQLEAGALCGGFSRLIRRCGAVARTLRVAREDAPSLRIRTPDNRLQAIQAIDE